MIPPDPNTAECPDLSTIAELLVQCRHEDMHEVPKFPLLRLTASPPTTPFPKP